MSGWNVNVVDVLEVGSPQSVKIVDEFAYVGYGGLLRVLDISEPTTPQKVGFVFLSSAIIDIERIGDYLYCVSQTSDQYSLEIVDIADRANPVFAGSMSIQGSAIHADGNRLYTEHGNGVRIHDISDPTNPQLLGSFSSPNVSDIDSRNGLVYVGTGISGQPALQIVDTTNPANPSQLVLFPILGFPTEIALSGNYVYVVTFYNPNRFGIVDVTNPNAPAIVSSVPGSNFFDVTIEGHYAFVGDYYGLLRVYDILNPTTPVALPPFRPCDAYGMNVLEVSGGIAALDSDYYNLCFVNVSSPNNPADLGSHPSLPYASSIDLANAHLAVSKTYGGLALVDRYALSIDSHAPIPTYSVDGSEVAVKGDRAYIAMSDSWYNSDDALAVVDVSDPDNPTLVAKMFTPWFPGPLSLGANHVYLATSEGLWIVDVSTSIPAKVGELPLSIGGLFANEPYLYAKTQNHLQVVDVSDPTTPFVAASLPLAGYADVWASGTFAYVTSDPGLQIVDVSNPLNPTLVGSIALPSSAYLRVRDQYAYVSAGDHLRIIDVSNPTNPVEVGNIATHSLWARVVTAPPYIYAQTDGPLVVFETPLITPVSQTPRATFALEQNYPNPFNPSTTIAFEIPSNVHVRLDIFDVRGRLVRRLADESMPAGSHSVVWDGRDNNGRAIGSGVYFYRLEASGMFEARKMVILK